MSFGLLALAVAAGLVGPLLASLRHFGPPEIVGEIAAGVVIGTSGFGWVDPTDPLLTGLAAIGFALLMFIVGTHLPVRDLQLRWRARPCSSLRRVRAIGRGVHKLRGLSRDRGWGLDLRVSLLALFTCAWLANRFGTSILIAGFAVGAVVAVLGEPRRVAEQLVGIGEGFAIPLFFSTSVHRSILARSCIHRRRWYWRVFLPVSPSPSTSLRRSSGDCRLPWDWSVRRSSGCPLPWCRSDSPPTSSLLRRAPR